MSTILLPHDFVPTHQTDGLPGFPAIDLFAAPGTLLVASESGVVTRVSGHDPRQPPPQGVGGAWGLSCYFVTDADEITFYLTHFERVARPDTLIRRGDVLGVIGDYPGLAADHAHVGRHPGLADQAGFASTSFPDRCYLTGSKPPPPPPPPSRDPTRTWGPRTWAQVKAFLRRGRWRHS